LARGIDRQQPEISTLTTRFEVNTTAQTIVILGNKKRALCERLVDFVERDAIAVDKESFGNTKGGIDYRGDLLGVGRVSNANFAHVCGPVK